MWIYICVGIMGIMGINGYVYMGIYGCICGHRCRDVEMYRHKTTVVLTGQGMDGIDDMDDG